MTCSRSARAASELTRHVLTRYHARHRKQLPTLMAMADNVETVHLGDEDAPEGLSDLLHRMIDAMEVHVKKEELILFPAIRAGGGKGIENPIAAMRSDHENHDRDIAEVRRLIGNLTLPDGACGTWAPLYAGFIELIDDLTEHMPVDNDALFPQFDRG